ncbi:hypothetical protein B0H11DRAFT_1940061 [Mycena galericulata]|nr:hypothetical protein B0H11DRAFT_1940061 [Mycena galericulata]
MPPPAAVLIVLRELDAVIVLRHLTAASSEFLATYASCRLMPIHPPLTNSKLKTTSVDSATATPCRIARGVVLHHQDTVAIVLPRLYLRPRGTLLFYVNKCRLLFITPKLLGAGTAQSTTCFLSCRSPLLIGCSGSPEINIGLREIPELPPNKTRPLFPTFAKLPLQLPQQEA